MHGIEKRTAPRFVIDGLFVEFNGVIHETLDISVRAVALVQRASVDYSTACRSNWFLSANAAELTRPIAEMTFVTKRDALVVFDYAIREPQFDPRDWEAILRRHDVRADVATFDKIFA
jgi:hypothetical protein